MKIKVNHLKIAIKIVLKPTILILKEYLKANKYLTHTSL